MSQEKMITTSSDLSIALHSLFARVDFATIGAVKDHFEKDENKEKTDKVVGQFLTAQVRMPKGTPITIGGDAYYPTTFAVKVDAFHLEGDKPEGTVTARAASVNNAELLRAKLNKPAPDANGTIAVEAVPAK